MSEAILEVNGLSRSFDGVRALADFSCELLHDEILALIGPNGAGKSTVLNVVCGLIPVWKGEIRFNGTPTNGSTPAQNVARRITFAPQGNRVFADLTVMENLEIGGYPLPRKEAKERIARVLELFPVLKERTRQDAGRLSGGEQQMLALARALVPKPKLLMLDEPSLGLAPNLVATVFKRIAEISREAGVAILIVEQKVREVLEICNRVYSMKLGRIVFEGQPEELKVDKTKIRDLFL